MADEETRDPELLDEFEVQAWSSALGGALASRHLIDDALDLADLAVEGLRERRGTTRGVSLPDAVVEARAAIAAARAPKVSESARQAWRSGAICVVTETLDSPLEAAEVQSFLEHMLGPQDLAHNRSIAPPSDPKTGAVVDQDTPTRPPTGDGSEDADGPSSTEDL
jgi:hypothetical protein